MGGRSWPTWWLWAGALSAGCSTLAGIDDDYVRADDVIAGTAGSGGGGFNGVGGEGGLSGASGNAGSSGEQGTGGTDGASGTDGSGGSAGADPADAAGGLDGVGGTGGTDPGGASGNGGSGCPPNQKSCNDVCVEPSPGVGCSLANCEPCPAPVANSEVLCGAGQCVARCKMNYVAVGGECVPENSIDAAGGAGGNGGNGGTSGRGGSGGRCVASECPSCSIFRGFACCTFFGDCGCGFVDRFYCL